MISDQKISDRMPRTLSGVAGRAMLWREAFAQRIERAGADVAVHDAERAERECEEVTLAVLLL